MKWFSNLKISTKLITGFFLVALVAGIVGVFGIYNIKTLDKSYSELYSHQTVPISILADISVEFQKSRVDVRDMIAAEDSSEIEEYVNKISEIRAKVTGLSKEFEKLIESNEMRTAYDVFLDTRKEYGAQLDIVTELARVNRDEEALALIADDGKLGIASKAEQDAINTLTQMKLADAAKKSEHNTEQANSTIVTMGIICVGAMLLALLLGWFISRIISKPIKQASYMIKEMSMGHLSNRLKMDTKDEIGEMAKAMDSFADDLQNVLIGTMNKISNGDVSVNITPKDDKDEITPALKNTIESIRALVDETGRLIKATQEGKLDTRGNANPYSGSWKEIVVGINNLIDAFVSPINVTAEYIDRISKGDIPAKITDTYLGDFNEIKNNLNTCIDAVNALAADANMLAGAAVAGEFETRADASKHGGDFRKIVEGVNHTLDTVVDKVFWYESILDAVPFPLSVTDLDMNWTFINKPVENLLNVKRKDIIGQHCSNWNANICKTENCGIAGLKRNKLQTMFEQQGMNFQVDTSYINNAKGEKIGHIEVVQDVTAKTKGQEYQKIEVERLASNLALMAQGNLELDLQVAEGNEYTKVEKENFSKINESLLQVKGALNLLVADARMLVSAAMEGKLATRADASKHGGDFAKIVDGVNKTLDAVIKPVQEAASVLNEMSNGNLQLRVTGNYQGDHAEIKNALNETLDAISSYVDEIASVLTEMANSKMVVEISGEYKGDFAPIKQALNLIIESFNQVLSDINNAADQVAAGSRQVSDGSQVLSQGATEQASSIEQLTASITEVAAQTKQNAVSANEANDLALTAKNNAADGNAQMKDMLKAMEEINTSSANISKIIKVIDEIAFQTNILALNAAVEAARAGQHGKGFAVVAEEVRNLAARSASAAKETTGLIEGSIKKVEIGTKIANETATSLDKIVNDVAKAANLVGTIAAASNEQATAIAQVNQGVEQVSCVVQTNSATAEQSAAASEELSGQAGLLKEMIGRFKLKNGEILSGRNLHPDYGVTKSLSDGGVKRYASDNKNFRKNTGTPKNPKIALSDAEFGKY